jgi:hypothetical protein
MLLPMVLYVIVYAGQGGYMLHGRAGVLPPESLLSHRFPRDLPVRQPGPRSPLFFSSSLIVFESDWVVVGRV